MTLETTVMNKMLKSSQHGFLKNRSYPTNLLEFLESLHKHIVEGCSIDVAYLDFSKAFDQVPWKTLLEKLGAHSVDG